LAGTAVAALGASAGELGEVKTVYLLPMPNGLDQSSQSD